VGIHVQEDGAYYGPESGTRWFGLWDGFFAVSYLVTALLVAISDAPQIHHFIAIGALTLIAPWYAALGRRLMITKEYGPGNLLFALVLMLLFAVATAADLTSTYALFAASPMLIMSLPMRQAAVLVTATSLWPVAVAWLNGAVSVWRLLPLSLITIPLSLLLGLWISRVVRQNKERGGLIEELRRSQERVAKLSHEAGVAAERERLAREVHDTLAQSLISVISLVETAESEVRAAPDLACEHLALAGQVARDSLAEARDFVAARTPPALRGGSLEQAVRRQADGLITETGLDVRCSVRGQEQALPMAVNVVLLRSVQEAIANIRKHATGARTVDVVMAFDEGTVRLEIRDDGEGFTPDGMHEGYGLRGMRARVAEIDGTATVTSHPGEGTLVEVSVPVPVLTGRR
jgi:signal transduction histidine kinase